MKFTLKDSGVLECLSESGHTYEISTSSCSCRGFSFHRICKHFKEATELGLIDKLQKMMEIEYQSIDVREEEVIITAGMESKAMLIGRGRAREAELRDILEQYFGIKYIKII